MCDFSEVIQICVMRAGNTMERVYQTSCHHISWTFVRETVKLAQIQDLVQAKLTFAILENPMA